MIAPKHSSIILIILAIFSRKETGIKVVYHTMVSCMETTDPSKMARSVRAIKL